LKDTLPILTIANDFRRRHFVPNVSWPAAADLNEPPPRVFFDRPNNFFFFFFASKQGCQIFLGAWYQKQKNCTK
jgi:hypothetical protein